MVSIRRWLPVGWIPFREIWPGFSTRIRATRVADAKYRKAGCQVVQAQLYACEWHSEAAGRLQKRLLIDSLRRTAKSANHLFINTK